MQVIEVLKPFAWSDNGWDVTLHQVGDIVAVSNECAAVEADLGNAKPLSHSDLDAAVAAHAELVKIAEAAETAADKAAQKAADLRARAELARWRADRTRVGREALDAAAQLVADEPASDPAEPAKPEPAEAATQPGLDLDSPAPAAN